MNTNDIKRLAHLSRLHLTDEEVTSYTEQFDEIVAYVDKIKEVSGSEDSNQTQQSPGTVNDAPLNVLREDIVQSYAQPEQIIQEAPSHQDNFVKVKKILQQ